MSSLYYYMILDALCVFSSLSALVKLQNLSCIYVSSTSAPCPPGTEDSSLFFSGGRPQHQPPLLISLHSLHVFSDSPLLGFPILLYCTEIQVPLGPVDERGASQRLSPNLSAAVSLAIAQQRDQTGLRKVPHACSSL